MKIETLYNCLGYFGFGSGVDLSQRSPSEHQQGTAGYCNTCQFAQACWQLHRERCQKHLPDICAHIDELGKQPDGQKKIMEFVKKHKTEPYSAIMMGNLEDGAHIACKLPPKDRGELTLKFPFKQ
jgi:hypothetical protein